MRAPQMADLDAFLATVPVFAALDVEARAAVAARCRERALPAGARLLAQGARNQTLYVLRAGQVVVRARQNDRIETLARLSPPAILGEISFLTGRACSADVDVVVDATVVELPLEALAALPGPHALVVRGLAGVVADRLHSVVTGDGAVADTPVVLIEPGRAWAAPNAFAAELTRALARETGGDALLVRIVRNTARVTNTTAAPFEPGVAAVSLATDGSVNSARSTIAARLPEWTTRFTAIVILPFSPDRGGDAEGAAPFATHTCLRSDRATRRRPQRLARRRSSRRMRARRHCRSSMARIDSCPMSPTRKRRYRRIDRPLLASLRGSPRSLAPCSVRKWVSRSGPVERGGGVMSRCSTRSAAPDCRSI